MKSRISGWGATIPMVIAFLMVIVAGCSETGFERQDAAFYLYAGMYAPPGGNAGFVAIIDCEEDIVLDSITDGFSEFVVVSASPDGKYLATYPRNDALWIYDARTRQPLTDLAIRLPNPPLFVPEANLMVAPFMDSTQIYRTPGFTVDTTLALELLYPQRIPGTTLLIGVDRRPGRRNWDYSRLLIVDYTDFHVEDTLVVAPDSEGFGISVRRRPQFSPDGRYLYVVGRYTNGSTPQTWLVGYDLVGKRSLFSVDVMATEWRVTPDGDEIWLPRAGSALFDVPVQYGGWIDIFDAHTGALKDHINLSGLGPDSFGHPLTALDVRFHPNGDKAYVNCGLYSFEPSSREPILVVDVQKRTVMKSLFNDFSNLAMFIDLAPQP